MFLKSWDMKSNYNKIGQYIRLVDERNFDLKVETLLGLTINKDFIPSVANTVGSDMSRYKIIRKNQFACSLMQVRRDKKIPVALQRNYKEAIISQAYPVFDVTDKDELLPEYLMMWFSRSEFDREACFYAVGGVRGSLEWEDFCNMQLPVPDIEKQKAIVKEYNTIVNRIKLNEHLNQKLEETAQAIYKEWFVEFEFPMTKEYAESIGKPELEGKAYMANGGEMVWNEELGKEIPVGWRDGNISKIVDLIDGDRGNNYPSQEEMTPEGHCLFLNAGNVTKNGFALYSNSFISEGKDKVLRKGKLKRHDVVLTTRGTVGNLAYYGKHIEYENIRINSGMILMRGKKEEQSFYTYFLMKSADMKVSINNYLSGSAQPQFPIKDIVQIPILVPALNNICSFTNKIQSIQDRIDLSNKERRLGTMLSDIISSKMAKAQK